MFQVETAVKVQKHLENLKKSLKLNLFFSEFVLGRIQESEQNLPQWKSLPPVVPPAMFTTLARNSTNPGVLQTN
jgi:hypothetical protein